SLRRGGAARLPALIAEPPQVSRSGMGALQAQDFPSWPRSQGGGRTLQDASEHTTAGGQGFSLFAGVWRPRRSPPPEDPFSASIPVNSPPPVFALEFGSRSLTGAGACVGPGRPGGWRSLTG